MLAQGEPPGPLGVSGQELGSSAAWGTSAFLGWSAAVLGTQLSLLGPEEDLCYMELGHQEASEGQSMESFGKSGRLLRDLAFQLDREGLR